MRSPVPKNRLVTLTLLAALLTGALTVGLAYPTLLPGTDTIESPAAGDQAIGVAGAGGAAPTATPGMAGDGTPTAAPETPTPNPNFTPAVKTTTPSGHEYEEHEHEHDEGGWDGE